MKKINYRNSIAARLFLGVLGFSLMTSIFLSGIGMYDKYRQYLIALDDDFETIENSYVPAITNALWVMNRDELQILMNGILNFPHMGCIHIKSKEQLIVSAGAPGVINYIERRYPLIYRYDNSVVSLGSLHIYADRNSMYDHLIEHNLKPLIYQTILEVFSIAFILFLLTRVMVTRHLTRLASQVLNIKMESSGIPAALPVRQHEPEKQDEIDQLAVAINTMNLTQQKIINQLASELAWRQKTEITLRESAEKFRDFVEGTDNFVAQVDGEGRLTYVNNAALHIFGVSKKECLGNSVFDFIHSEDREKTRVAFDGWLRDRLPSVTFENRQVNQKTGQIHHLSWTINLYFDENGKAVKINSIARDVTELKKAEKALKMAHFDLERKVKERTIELQKIHNQLLHVEKLGAIGKLSASIAHEFNNPLYGVMGVISGIKKRTALSAKDEELIDMALKECHRMKNLIQDLQDFNRPTSGRFAPLDIHSALDSILLLNKKELNEKKIMVIKNYAVDMPLLFAIGDQIKQVFLNLLKNAAEACDDEGTITITTCFDEHQVSILIADTGRGIKPEYLDNIFDPFFTTKPEIKGTGLGLSVSYGIIKRHGGSIVAESEYGKGASFTVTLPVKQESR